MEQDIHIGHGSAACRHRSTRSPLVGTVFRVVLGLRYPQPFLENESVRRIRLPSPVACTGFRVLWRLDIHKAFNYAALRENYPQRPLNSDKAASDKVIGLTRPVECKTLTRSMHRNSTG
ncbi:hypothetical protein [Burkholderia cepacia]|uniref:hypothetical protein n=1 Tax=Burkholderia cepacia TaxID=292 RepID=UPI00398E8A8A